MARGYVTIMVTAGSPRDVLAQIRETDGVTHADPVVGRFDIIAEVEARSEHALLLLVTDELRSLSGVGRTHTCLVADTNAESTAGSPGKRLPR